jgi:hypothetical protein
MAEEVKAVRLVSGLDAIMGEPTVFESGAKRLYLSGRSVVTIK